MKVALVFLAFAILFVIVHYFLIPFVIYHYPGDLAKSGQFGDSFGAANALFSGLAFIGVAMALYHQQLEIKHERSANASAREEAKEIAQIQRATAQITAIGIAIQTHKEELAQAEPLTQRHEQASNDYDQSHGYLEMLMVTVQPRFGTMSAGASVPSR